MASDDEDGSYDKNNHINYTYINHYHNHHNHHGHNNHDHNDHNNNDHLHEMRERLDGGWGQVFLLCIWSGKLLDRSHLLHRAWRNPCHH